MEHRQAANIYFFIYSMSMINLCLQEIKIFKEPSLMTGTCVQHVYFLTAKQVLYSSHWRFHKPEMEIIHNQIFLKNIFTTMIRNMMKKIAERCCSCAKFSSGTSGNQLTVSKFRFSLWHFFDSWNELPRPTKTVNNPSSENISCHCLLCYHPNTWLVHNNISGCLIKWSTSTCR